jgi:hypothetical protein
VDRVRSQQADQEKSPLPPAPAPEPESFASAAEEPSALLESCEKTSLVAIPVDPYVVHCQWEIAHADLDHAKRALGVDEDEYWPILRFYDVTSGDQTGRYPSFTVDVQLGAGNWYVRSCSPERSYRADLALKREDGSLAVIASADRVETPPSAPSSYADEHWLPIRLGPPVRLPIDVREEVSRKLSALYGVQEQGFFESRLQGPMPADRSEEADGKMADLPGNKEPEPPGLVGQPSLPVDMRAEVSQVLTQLYAGLHLEPSAPASPFTRERFPMRCAGSGSEALTKRAIADLTAWNERSFKSGVSSR